MIFENIAGIAREEEYDNCRNQAISLNEAGRPTRRALFRSMSVVAIYRQLSRTVKYHVFAGLFPFPGANEL